MNGRRKIDAEIQHIEREAATQLWQHRDDLTVDLVLSAHQIGAFGKPIVRYGDYIYHPVVTISNDLSTATAMAQTPGGVISLQAGHGPLSEAWDAALSWRLLKLLQGRDPVLREKVVASRPRHRDGRDGIWSRLWRHVSPTITLTDPHDIVRHDLAMHVVTLILENGLRARMPEFVYDLGHGVELQVLGLRSPRYSIVHPDNVRVAVPDHLKPMYDEVIPLHEKSMAPRISEWVLQAT